MEFYQVTGHEEMKKGSFSIMEPVADENKCFKEDDRALMIVRVSHFQLTGTG